jgi:GrpB-like predicted nucleotidyltransferase (UPF0157 family)
MTLVSPLTTTNVIEIVDYDASWPARFAAEAARLAEVTSLVGVHHIGSTAVPGLAAKPIIDMIALVDDLDLLVDGLTDRAGYEFPEKENAGLVRRRWFCHPSEAYRTHHLHLVTDPNELARCLRFRDALRADDATAERYAVLKRDLARRFSADRAAYTAAKTEFIGRVESHVT